MTASTSSLPPTVVGEADAQEPVVRVVEDPERLRRRLERDGLAGTVIDFRVPARRPSKIGTSSRSGLAPASAAVGKP